jgi:predicted aminopeptidase
MRARAAVLVVASVALGGCDTMGYYAQAIGGQAEIWRLMRPLEQVIADPQSSPTLKRRLQLAARIRAFASRELGLPDNGSYRAYADLRRRYVVWNVFAAEELSVKPKQWCFPVAGCVAYKGFFNKAQAEGLAAELKRAKFDVFVSGVPAYSMLGYLDDPLLNTFIHYPPTELARLIFHELAHQVAYAQGDTEFNESFAVTVAREGVRRWLRTHGATQELHAFEVTLERRDAFHAIAQKYRRELAEVYAAASSDERKRAAKAEVFAALAVEYGDLKKSWGGFKGYDRWFSEQANNASLASIAVYTQQVPAFQALLAKLGGDLPRFYTQVRELADLPKNERSARLAAQ